jgi:hypothetical protein
MRADLAQRLLAKVMGWDGDRLLQEQPVLQVLAQFKYDEYENFEPGFKFVESLARWLAQFDFGDRAVAYRYVRSHLVFVSRTEMQHLVRTVYPDVIRPIIRAEAAGELGVPPHALAQIDASPVFRELRRRSLFLGLSDGARIDAFRRSSLDLDNEQVHAQYELSLEKLRSMHGDLTKALRTLGRDTAPATFRLVFLLDDFAGTGTTMLRREDDGSYSGRLKKVSQLLLAGQEIGAIAPDARVVVCLYIATHHALDRLRGELDTFAPAAWRTCEVIAHQVLDARLRLARGDDPALDAFLDKYYRTALEDRESYRVGGTGIKYGYGACGLPLVLHHNTPNNSVYLLWKEGNAAAPAIPLFRRFERHRGLVEGDAHGDR